MVVLILFAHFLIGGLFPYTVLNSAKDYTTFLYMKKRYLNGTLTEIDCNHFRNKLIISIAISFAYIIVYAALIFSSIYLLSNY
jgi:hypothetical protein